MKTVISAMFMSFLLCFVCYGTEQAGKRQIQVEVLYIKAPADVLKELGISPDMKVWPDTKKLSSICAKRKDVELSSPAATVVEGVKGGISVTGPVQYMEKMKNDDFALKTHDKQNGSVFNTVATIEKDGRISIDVDFKLATLSGRLPIEGVQLDIGYPIFVSRVINTTVILKDGEIKSIGELITERSFTAVSKTGEKIETRDGFQGIILLTAYILQERG